MIVVEIQPSRLLVILVVAMHAVAAFSFLFGAVPPGVWVPGIVAIGASLLHFMLVRRRHGARRLGLMEDGGLVVEPNGKDDSAASLGSATVASGVAVWLAWQDAVLKRSGTVLVFRDQLPAADWRALQIWVRLRGASSIARQEGDRSS